MKFVNFHYGEAKAVMAAVRTGARIYARGYSQMNSLRRAGLNLGQRISVQSLDGRLPGVVGWYHVNRLR